MSSNKKFLKSCLQYLGCLGLGVFGAGILWIGYSFNQALEPKVDPALYAGIATDHISSSSDYAFLPKEIDPEAEAVGFYYVPGFLQGGDVLSLRLKLPEEKVTKVISDLEASGRPEVDSLVNLPVSNIYPKLNISESQKDNPLVGDGKLPSGFRIFTFKSDIADIEENWNHNFLAFTAVSLDKREVVYYTNSW